MAKAAAVPSFASLALAGLVLLASSSSRDGVRVGFVADTFVPSTPTFASRAASQYSFCRNDDGAHASASLRMAAGTGGEKKTLVVVSPPGGVGEVAAVHAAKSGHAVRWFVVDAPSSKSSVRLPSSALDAVAKAGGSVELAGSDSASLLLPTADADSSVGAVGRWCGSADGVIATLDGIDDVEFGADVTDVAESKKDLADAVLVAAREAARAGGKKVAVLPAPTVGEEDEEEGGGGVLGGVLGSLLGGGDSRGEVPSSLSEALGGTDKAVVLRYGELFGLPEIFRTSFGSVPDKDRLADWLATKWAPAVLRTYDIAGIRVGARPVYASRKAGADVPTVEIVWQELKDFESVTVGSMTIEVDEKRLVARRGPGDAKAGYGSISPSPLNAEDVLVRRLADAASQAVEKGLAKKAAETKKAKQPKPTKKVATRAAPSVTTVAASGTAKPAAPATAAAAAATAAASETGPRAAGARRSSERTRGRRRKAAAATKTPPPPVEDKSADAAAPPAPVEKKSEDEPFQ